MLYAVGTHIDLSYLNAPKPGAIAAQFDDKPKRNLYKPGTHFKFIKDLSLPPQIIVPAM